MTSIRTTLAAAATAAVALAGVLTGPAQAHAPAPSTSTTARVAVPTTTLTLQVAHCEGCRIQAWSAVWSGDRSVWHSRVRKVRNGQVSFTVPTSRTRGLSLWVTPTWQLTEPIGTGYVTMAAFRYARTVPGQQVSRETALSRKHGSMCFAGTDRSELTMRLNVEKVRVQGNGGMTDGAIAWFPTTRRAMLPMQRAYQGILGAQDVVFCGQQ